MRLSEPAWQVKHIDNGILPEFPAMSSGGLLQQDFASFTIQDDHPLKRKVRQYAPFALVLAAAFKRFSTRISAWAGRPVRHKIRRAAPYAVAGFICIALIWSIFGSGRNVLASVASVHEEWVAAELPVLRQQLPEQQERLKPGDSALVVLSRLGFSMTEITAMIAAARKVHPLKNIRAGQSFVRRGRIGDMHVYYQADAGHLLHLSNSGHGWKASMTTRAVYARPTVKHGKILDNLFLDAVAAGLDDRTTMNLVDIFAWDIDFARDLRRGDSFTVLTEEHFDMNGELLDSTILAAEFVNQGKTYQAIRFETSPRHYEYFSPAGKSMRKAYLKAPVKFSRISSRFQLKRRHPILGYTRAHRGVDYAAPSGTPVHAVGDGYVTRAGWRGGYGRYVEIRHTNASHSTAYAHLRRYGKGIRRGRKVRQGQIIGYVGMSGLATGPHLHFEFRVHGRAVNPLTVKRAPARPVPRPRLAGFRAHASQALTRMQQQATLPSWS